MESALPRYDIDGLARELEVDISDLADLFSSYFSEMKDEILNMERLALKSEWGMLERVVHNIKGVSANLGINDVFNEASSFDMLLKDDKTDDVGMHVKRLIALINDAEVEVKAFFTDKI